MWLRQVLRCAISAVLLILSLAAESTLSQDQNLSGQDIPNSEKALKSQIKDFLKIARLGNEALLAESLKSMLLPNHEAWFLSVFGETLGPQLAAGYTRQKDQLASHIAQQLRAALDAKMTEVEVSRFGESCDERATEAQYPILAVRKRPESLYDVFLSRADYGYKVWFFAYADGGFRYLGQMNDFAEIVFPREIGSATDDPAAASPDTVRVGGTVQRAKLIRQDRPHYPEKAKRLGIQGTVRLLAILDQEGKVKQLTLLRGKCWLAEAAVEAVRKWRYSPTLLNGKSVEVVTTIDVVFTLSYR